jgi:hypothetical protein
VREKTLRFHLWSVFLGCVAAMPIEYVTHWKAPLWAVLVTCLVVGVARIT